MVNDTVGRLRISSICYILITISASALVSSAQVLVGTVPIGSAIDLVANTRTSKVYVTRPFNRVVTVIDEHTLQTTAIPITSPEYVAVDERRNKIYVSGAGLSVIDGATNTATQINNSFATEQLAVNEDTNKIYALAPGQNLVLAVDGNTFSASSIPVGTYPQAIAVNVVTNKVYVANYDGTLTIIDGSTSSTTTIQASSYPIRIVVDRYRNKIYVASLYGQITIIDGGTLATRRVDAGFIVGLGINTRTNKIYVAGGALLTELDGDTLSTVQIPLALAPAQNLTVEPVTNRIYVYGAVAGGVSLKAINGLTHSVKSVFTTTDQPGGLWPITSNSADDRVYAVSPSQQLTYVVTGPSALRFVPLPPCRVVDTRGPDGPFGGPAIQGGTERDFPLPQGTCNIPGNAAAYSLNATVVPHGRLDYLTIWPTGQSQPEVSTMNSDGRVKANAAIVPGGAGGGISVFASNTTDVILDVNGYFTASSATALAFYPLTSCRAIDTRSTNPPYLSGGHERDFPLLGTCGIPSNARGYSLNVTALPHGRLDYLTVWPDGQPQPLVSTLNAPTGTVTANAALATGGVDGEIAVYPSADTDLLVDVNGYFAPLGPGGLSLYAVLPCRISDTRLGRGRFSGTILIDVYDSGCGLEEANALVLNATVVPQGFLGYLTIWPTTEFQPATSTLNAMDGAVTSNMLIVQDIDGWLNAFASNSTHLILDGFGYFAP